MMMTIIVKIHCLNRAWLNRPFHNLLNSVNTALQSCEICVPLPPTSCLFQNIMIIYWALPHYPIPPYGDILGSQAHQGYTPHYVPSGLPTQVKISQKNALSLSVHIFHTKLLIGDTIFRSPNRDWTAILSGHPSHTKVQAFARQRKYPHFSVIFRPWVLVPPRNRTHNLLSAVKRSPNWGNPTALHKNCFLLSKILLNKSLNKTLPFLFQNQVICGPLCSLISPVPLQWAGKNGKQTVFPIFQLPIQKQKMMMKSHFLPFLAAKHILR